MTLAGSEGVSLSALQLADSALPVGRFVHSQGLEAWFDAHPDAGEAQLAALLSATLSESIAPLDGAAVVHAHGATALAALVRLDREVSARKLSSGARQASHACGRQLLALAIELRSDPLVGALLARVRAGDTDGNAAVAMGAVSRSHGLPVADAVLIELRGIVSAQLGVAVRLGRLPALRAQIVLHRLGPAIACASNAALDVTPDAMWSSAPELEIAALNHTRLHARFFRT